ncbi:hypothetical protein ABPG72_013223 [Tetrahymena utriculariae]
MNVSNRYNQSIVILNSNEKNKSFFYLISYFSDKRYNIERKFSSAFKRLFTIIIKSVNETFFGQQLKNIEDRIHKGTFYNCLHYDSVNLTFSATWKDQFRLLMK